jgi:hypothetical protein
VRFSTKNKEAENQISQVTGSEDLAIWYILASATDEELKRNIELLKENITFLDEQTNKNLYLFLKNNDSKVWENEILNSLELNKKEKYRGIALKIEEENKEKTRLAVETEIIKTAVWMNKEIYKNKVEVLKNKMNSWDSNALKEYSELVKQARTLWIK